MLKSSSFRPAAAWLWAALSIAAWFASLWIALPVASPVAELGAGLFPAGIRWDLAVFLALNAGVSMLAVLAIGRRLLGEQVKVGWATLVLPFIGVALAIAIELLLHQWAEARFGLYDAELVWWTAGLSFIVVLTAVGIFGVLVAPRAAIVPPLIGLVAAAAIVCLVVLSNVAGLADGIEPASWPLAISVGLAAVYAIACVGVALRRTVA